jgi:hypothetical protein
MQQILHDGGGIIVLMFNNYGSAHTGKLAHGELNSNFDHDGGYIYEALVVHLLPRNSFCRTGPLPH